MAPPPLDPLRRRLAAGQTTIEVVALSGPRAGARAYLAGDAGGALSEGGPVDLGGDLGADLGGDREAVTDAARRLGPGRRSGRARGPSGVEYYLERWAPAPRLAVFGGGHVGRAIAAAVRDLDFRVVVVEDRAYFADPARFEGEVECLRCPLPEGADRLGVGPEDYAVVVTRGHVEDLGCVRALAPRRPFYLGLLGSRRKGREFQAALAGEGLDPGDLARVRCPVGMAVGAETPEEIAAAVAAELIAARRGRLAG